jgi:hypothetical protein
MMNRSGLHQTDLDGVAGKVGWPVQLQFLRDVPAVGLDGLDA